MAGYSVKRNEILHLDSYNKTSANDNTVPLLRQLFLDLVGDGSDTYPNHGFKDVSPFITKIEVDDDTLVKAIINNYFKLYYKWAEAGRIGKPGTGGKIAYAKPKWLTTNTEEDNQHYPEMRENYLIVSREEFVTHYTTGGNLFYPIEKPQDPFARWMKYDEDGDMVEALETEQGFWALPVIAYKDSTTLTNPEVEFVADAEYFRAEVTKVINIITNSNRNNTISTNGSNPISGVIKQYKFSEDVVTGNTVHSFWVMTNKDTPLFQAESDKCLDALDQSDVTSTYSSQATCTGAGNTWVSGNVIPAEHEIVVDLAENLNPGAGHRYTVTLQIDPNLINPGSQKPYEARVFSFDNVDYINPEDLTSEYTFKRNLFMAFKGQTLSSEYKVTFEDGVLKVKDTKTGRPFTITIVDNGRLLDSADTSFTLLTQSNVIWNTYTIDPRYQKAVRLSAATTDAVNGSYPIGNTYTFNVTLTEDAVGIGGVPIPALDITWEYTVTNKVQETSQIVSKLIDYVNNHPENKHTYPVVGGEKTAQPIILSAGANGEVTLSSGVSEWKVYTRTGGLIVSQLKTYRDAQSAAFIGTTESIGTFTSSFTKATAAAGNPDFTVGNVITQQGQEGSNKDISFNFHMWKDMFFSPKYRYMLTRIDMDPLSSWDVQPMMSFDSPFDRVTEVSDKSMGPLVLETLPSVVNGFQLSGRVIDDPTKEKPQKWRIRFDVNRGVELRDQVKNIANMSDKTHHYEYLEVNIATEHQLLSDGTVTKLEGRDGLKDGYIKTPGYLGFLRDQVVAFSSENYTSVLGSSKEILDDKKYVFERMRMQKGFFRRSTKSFVENSYPMSYRLTVAPHGLFFHISDDAASDQSDDFAWFVVQRHVEVGTGKPNYLQTAPLHCVYMSSEPPTYLSDLESYYKTDPYQDSTQNRIESIFDQAGYESIANIQVPANVELGFPDFRAEGRFRRFIVREKNVLKPWDVHKLASINTVDSHAIINTQEQLSMTDKNKLTINFPNRLTSQSFVFTGSELDMIAYCDGGVIAESTFISSSRYNDNRVYEALRSTKANGNGMRILALCHGDVVTESDVIPEEVLNSV